MKDEQISLAELAEQSGIPARTIRFYIGRGLLPGPVKGGRGAVYSRQHVERLQQIKALQAAGRMLAEIGPLLDSAQPRAAPQPSAWWQYAVGSDVIVWTRADVAPWRMKQIRAAIDDLANRLTNEEEE